MYIAFDVGGTYVKHGVITEGGKILVKDKYPTDCEDSDNFLESIKGVIEEYSKEYNIEGIAMAMPGIIDVNTGHMKEAGAVFSLYGKNMKELLKKVTDLPVEIENDANCVALAEKFNGNAVECTDFICMTIGTGIGGGIVLNDRIHHGRGFIGGEFGHMRINSINPQENLHENCSTSALIHMYKKYADIDASEVVSGKEVFEAANKDEGVAAILNKWYENISLAIFNLSVTLCPEKILIGGGVSERKEFLDRIEDYLKEYEKWNNIDVKLGICKHKNDAGMLGALYHLLSRKNKD